MRMVHAPDPVRSDRHIRTADRCQFSAGEALVVFRARPDCGEKEFVAHEKREFAREERVVSFDSEIESLVQRNHLIKNNVVN